MTEKCKPLIFEQVDSRESSGTWKLDLFFLGRFTINSLVESFLFQGSAIFTPCCFLTEPTILYTFAICYLVQVRRVSEVMNFPNA